MFSAINNAVTSMLMRSRHSLPREQLTYYLSEKPPLTSHAERWASTHGAQGEAGPRAQPYARTFCTNLGQGSSEEQARPEVPVEGTGPHTWEGLAVRTRLQDRDAEQLCT